MRPVPLTWWQKFLKALGLYKAPESKGRTKDRDTAAPKSNTRDARGDRGEKSEPRSDDSSERPPRKRRERKPREPREERETPSTEGIDSKRLYLGNLSYEASETDLEELFRGIGNVRRAEVVYDRQTHRSKGYGFIDMQNIDEAKKAVEVLHDQFFMGRKLVVSSAKSEGPAKSTAESEEFRPRDVAPEPKPEKPEPTPEPVAEAPVVETPAAEATPAPVEEVKPTEPSPAEEAPAAETPPAAAPPEPAAEAAPQAEAPEAAAVGTPPSEESAPEKKD
jgi:RNA recognition motif-containing protein